MCPLMSLAHQAHCYLLTLLLLITFLKQYAMTLPSRVMVTGTTEGHRADADCSSLALKRLQRSCLLPQLKFVHLDFARNQQTWDTKFYFEPGLFLYGFHRYWHDKEILLEKFSMHHNGGASIMIHGASSFSGTVELRVL